MQLRKLAIAALLGSAAALGTTTAAHAQSAQTRSVSFNIPAGDLVGGLRKLSRQARVEVIYKASDLRGRKTTGVSGSLTVAEALQRLLAGSGATLVRDPSGAYLVRTVGNGVARNSGSQTASTVGGDTAGRVPAENDGAEIIVTGTNIRNIAPDSSPVDVITRREIDRSGLNSTADVIRTLPANFGGGLSVASRSSDATTVQNASRNRGFATGVNLRGLGSDSTLTLLNGNRLPIASEGYSVDISMIPLVIVERIEALKDGASSIYGSDAVAGVVNIITKERYDGFASSATVGGVTQGDKVDLQLSQLAGTTWDSGGLMAAVAYDRADSLSTAAKAISRDATDPSQLYPDIESYSIYAAANQNITDRLKLSANLLWNKRLIQSADAFIAGSDLAVSQRRTRTTGLLGAIGLSYNTGRWNIGLTGAYSRSNTSYYVLPNPVFEAFRQRIAGENISVEGKATGPVAELPGGTAQVAFGAAYRSEQFGVIDGFDLSRNIQAIYGELFIPLVTSLNAMPGVRRLEVTGSLRHEHYSDFGSTTNPKVGLVWSPVDALRFRGSFSTSFRAPLLTELQQFDALNFLLELPDPLSPTESSLSIYRIGGNPNLRPATARTFNIGATFAPQEGGFRLEIDYFNVRFKDRIDQPGGGAVLIETQPDVYGSFLIRNPSIGQVTELVNAPGLLNFFGPFDPADVQLIADARRTNLTAVFVDGIDAKASYSGEAAGGTLTASFDASYLLNYRETLVPGATAIPRRNTPYYPAAFRSRFALSWEKNAWSASLFGNYVGSYKDDRIETMPTSVDDFLTFDLSLACKPENVAFLRRSIISLSAQNIFDRAPPFVRNENLSDGVGFGKNYDASNASVLGRYISLRLSTEF